MLIVSYDIHNDKLRTKFAKLLQRYGRRLQLSVWELKNSDRVMSIILSEIAQRFQDRFEKSDSILIFDVCRGCQKKIVRYGYAVHEEEEIVFI